jgi:phage terminase large subunit GpA-like protein
MSQAGPSYCHFPVGRDLEYFEQLSAEKKYTRYVNGFPKQEWRKQEGVRNEALDCRVYSVAALHALFVSGLRLNQLCQQFDLLLKGEIVAAQTPRPAVAAPDAEQQYRRPIRFKVEV